MNQIQSNPINLSMRGLSSSSVLVPPDRSNPDSLVPSPVAPPLKVLVHEIVVVVIVVVVVVVVVDYGIIITMTVSMIVVTVRIVRCVDRFLNNRHAITQHTQHNTATVNSECWVDRLVDLFIFSWRSVLVRTAPPHRRSPTHFFAPEAKPSFPRDGALLPPRDPNSTRLGRSYDIRYGRCYSDLPALLLRVGHRRAKHLPYLSECIMFILVDIDTNSKVFRRVDRVV